MGKELRLEVSEFKNLTRWRWALTGPGGSLIADHEVRLDAGCWQYEAFEDLLSYLDWHVAPYKRTADEARIVAEVGAWIGAEVFGPVAAAMIRERPDAVRVVVPAEPEEARSLLFRPLELAHIGDKPLSLQGVTLVMQVGQTLAGLDGVDTAIVNRATDARDGKIAIPSGLWAAIGIGALLGDLVAAAADDAEAAGRASQTLKAMTAEPEWSALADVLRRILGGERDPGLADQVEDPVHQAVVSTVLEHIGAG